MERRMSMYEGEKGAGWEEALLYGSETIGREPAMYQFGSKPNCMIVHRKSNYLPRKSSSSGYY